MTVAFDADSLLAFAEPGTGDVERWLDRVYDGERDGYVTTVELADFRYIAARAASADDADDHIDDLRDMGVTDYEIDGLWERASDLKAAYGPSLGDAYAVAAARALDESDRDVTLLVGADDDYDVFEGEEGYEHLIERVRDDPA